MLNSPLLISLEPIIGIVLIVLFGFLGSYGTFRLVTTKLTYLSEYSTCHKEPRWVRLSLGAVICSAMLLAVLVALCGAGLFINILMGCAAGGLSLGILFEYFFRIYTGERW